MLFTIRLASLHYGYVRIGVLRDSKLTFSDHIHKARKKACGMLSALFLLLDRDSRIQSNKVSDLYYKTVICPVLTYAAPAWGQTVSSNMGLLQVMQNQT